MQIDCSLLLSWQSMLTQDFVDQWAIIILVNWPITVLESDTFRPPVGRESVLTCKCVECTLNFPVSSSSFQQGSAPGAKQYKQQDGTHFVSPTQNAIFHPPPLSSPYLRKLRGDPIIKSPLKFGILPKIVGGGVQNHWNMLNFGQISPKTTTTKFLLGTELRKSTSGCQNS